MSALTEALAAARKELDEHKEKHGGHYIIGCGICWDLLEEMVRLEEAVHVDEKARANV